jgi:hypothetical protein
MASSTKSFGIGFGVTASLPEASKFATTPSEMYDNKIHLRTYFAARYVDLIPTDGEKEAFGTRRGSFLPPERLYTTLLYRISDLEH